MEWVGICYFFWCAVYEGSGTGSSAGCAAGIEMDLTELAFKAMISVMKNNVSTPDHPGLSMKRRLDHAGTGNHVEQFATLDSGNPMALWCRAIRARP